MSDPVKVDFTINADHRDDVLADADEFADQFGMTVTEARLETHDFGRYWLGRFTASPAPVATTAGRP